MASASAISVDEEGHVNAALVVLDIYPQMMRDMIANTCPPKFVLMLIRNEHDKKFLNGLNALEKDIVEKLDIDGYSRCDVSIMYKLIRRFNLVKAPNQDWGHKPRECDIAEGDDVERMKRYRNDILHRPKGGISGEEKRVFFEDSIKMAQRRDNLHNCPQNGFESRIKNIKAHSVTKEKYIEALEKCAEYRERLDNINVTLCYGNDIAIMIGQNNQLNDENSTECTLYVRGESYDLAEIKAKVLAVLEKLNMESFDVQVINAEEGSLILYLLIKNFCFKSRPALHTAIQDFLTNLLTLTENLKSTEQPAEVVLALTDISEVQNNKDDSYLEEKDEVLKLNIVVPRTAFQSENTLYRGINRLVNGITRAAKIPKNGSFSEVYLTSTPTNNNDAELSSQRDTDNIVFAEKDTADPGQNTMATGGSTDQMNLTLLDMVDHLENLAKPVVNDLRQKKYCEYITLFLSHFGMERCIVTGSTQENTYLRRKENEGDFDYLMISGITIPSDCLEYKEYIPNFVKINGISLKDKFPDVELLDAKYLPSNLLSDMRPEAFKHMKAIFEFVFEALLKTTRKLNTLHVAFKLRKKPGISVTHYSGTNCTHLGIEKKNQGKNCEAIQQNIEQCLKDESPEIKSMTYSAIKAICRVFDAYEQIDAYQHDTESNLKQTYGPLFGAIGQSIKETFEFIIDKLPTSNMPKRRKFESQQIASDSVMVQTEEECLSSADNMNFGSDTNPTQTGSTPIAENRSEGEVLIQYSRKTCKNFIPVFPLLGKPKYLDEWKTRKRTSEWPPLHVITDIYSSEFFVVAKPAINHPETDRDFCLAYNLAEIRLAKAMTGVQRSVMLIIKAFQKTVLEQFSEELTTYHWKTAVYKVSESADKSVIENKTEENILGFLQDVLVFMANSLRENYLEHYFVPSNLFAGKVEEKMFEIASIVVEIQINPLETLRDFFVQEAVSELKYDIVSKNNFKEFHENYTDSGEYGLVRSIISLVKSFAIEKRVDVRDALRDVLTQAMQFFIEEEARGRERQNADVNSPYIQFLLGSEFSRDTTISSCVSLLLDLMICEHVEVDVQEIAQTFFSLVKKNVLRGNN